MVLPADMTPEWLERLLRNDEAAWRSLVRGYSGLLIALAARTFAAYGYEVSTHDCEDVASEVWKNILAHDKRLIRRALEKGFFLQTLHVLVRHRAIDRMRARKFKTVAYAEEQAASEPVPDPAPDVAPVRMEAAMQLLNSRERMVVNLFFLQTKSYREIAALTGMPQNSIGPTISRALTKLRRALQAPGTAG